MKGLIKSTLVTTVALVGIGIPTGAMAAAVTPADLDGLAIGGIVAGPLEDDFITPGGVDIGDLTNEVYFDGTFYTYVHTVLPGLNNISEFNTGFDVLGYTNGGSTLAGYSFGDADSALGPGEFSLFEDDDDGTLDWVEIITTNQWDSGESIRFFFQSTLAPGELSDYNLINARVGTAQSFAPVPLPPAVWLLGSGLVALFGIGRRKLA